MKAPATPPGNHWQLIPFSGPFTRFVGPVFVTTDGLDGDEHVRFGFRVEDHHCNLRETCHGGMLATFLDIALARGASHGVANFAGAPTINMTIDFLAPANLGDWVESRISFIHRARRTVFVGCTLVGPLGPLLRGSAIYRILTRKAAAE